MIDTIKSAAKKMLIDFEDTRRISHKPTKGRVREHIILESFLRPYLPSRYSIGSGLIVDSKNRESKQQDLMIYDEFYSPVLVDMEHDKILFPESVLVTIEAKSTLAAKDITDMIEKSASVWGLAKAPLPNVAIFPGAILSSGYVPTLCIGMCFESTLTLRRMASEIRDRRGEVDNDQALSLVCVLNDKDQKPGLIVNVREENLRQIVLIPSPSSRLAVIECDTPGDALLYTYLLIMEHLRHCGAIIPGPNLMHYAQASGLGLPSYLVSPDEMKGASVEIEGKVVEVDKMERVRALSLKVMHGEASDEEILDWFFHLPYVPSGESILDPRGIFRVNEQPVAMPGTLVVYEAVRRHMKGEPVEGDQDVIKQFIELIRSIQEDKRLEMGLL